MATFRCSQVFHLLCLWWLYFRSQLLQVLLQLKIFFDFFEIKKVPWQTGISKLRLSVRQDTFKPCVLPIQVSYEHLYIKHWQRIYLLSLFQNDRYILLCTDYLVLLHCYFYQYFLVMPFTEYFCFASVAYHKNSAVLSLYTRCLVMTSRTDERHSVRIRFQNSASFSRDT